LPASDLVESAGPGDRKSLGLFKSINRLTAYTQEEAQMANTTKQPTFKKLILEELKAKGHHAIAGKIKSIKYRSFSMGDAVDVSAVNLWKSEREILEDLLSEYRAGSFNSMEDMYEYKKGPDKKPRTAKYVHLDNEFSPDIKDDVKAMLALDGITDNDTAYKRRGHWFDQVVWLEIRDLCGGLKRGL
jgi:hypothetical protein